MRRTEFRARGGGRVYNGAIRDRQNGNPGLYEPMHTVLIATYELGRQPFGLASPAAWLRRAGVEVTCVDLSREPFRVELAEANLVAFHLPMHTATRLAVPVIKRVRALNPDAVLCCYGLYAPLNATGLRALGVGHILGGEFEADLVEIAVRGAETSGQRSEGIADRLPRLAFITPDRGGLPALERYATLQCGPTRKVVGYTEASRGCKHRCRHCPVVPVYDGRFRIVPPEVVLADIRAQVARGAEHMTFGDPDFFNGVRHAMRVVHALAREFPDLTYDVTIKVEHLLRHAAELGRLRDTGCVFITSAVESFDDMILTRLAKGHRRADVERAVALCCEVGVVLVPTFVAFTPWTTLAAYGELLAEIRRLDLIDHVAPIQLAIRLLVPAGSRLLELDEVRTIVKPFDPVRLIHPWDHVDPKVDALADAIGRLVGRRPTASRREIFADVWDLACAGGGASLAPPSTWPPQRVEVPFLNEPWYC